ncbi:hypothetical protein QBC38DRAFT_517674 [Podospora fimiseda]|uniref:Uncharacterized protein n=1 Tax=Podospora fimiseda TaxID=252190 RepID=A0AAN7GNF3_9PEZI|nr:hypothetical protein QBC38DRAFT_517674 [Podospora fimiseda]
MSYREDATPNKRALQAVDTLVHRWGKTRETIFEDFNNAASQAFWVALNSWSRQRNLSDYEEVKRLMRAGHSQNPQRGLPRVPSDPSRWLPTDIWTADSIWIAEEIKRYPDSPHPTPLDPKERKSLPMPTVNSRTPMTPSPTTTGATGRPVTYFSSATTHSIATFEPVRSFPHPQSSLNLTTTIIQPQAQVVRASASASIASFPSSPTSAEAESTTAPTAATSATATAPSDSPTPPPSMPVGERLYRMRTRLSAAREQTPLAAVTNVPKVARLKRPSEKTETTPGVNSKKRPRMEPSSPKSTTSTAHPAAVATANAPEPDAPEPDTLAAASASPEPHAVTEPDTLAAAATSTSASPEPHKEGSVTTTLADDVGDDVYHHHEEEPRVSYHRHHRHYPNHDDQFGFGYEDNEAMHSAVGQSCSAISIQVTYLENDLKTLVAQMEEHQDELARIDARIKDLEAFLSEAPDLESELEDFLSKIEYEQAEAEKALSDFKEWQAKYPAFAKDASDETMRATIKRLADDKSDKEAQLAVLPEEIKSKTATLKHLQGQKQNLYLLIDDRAKRAEIAQMRYNDARDYLDLISLGPATLGRIRRKFPQTKEESAYIYEELKKIQAPVMLGGGGSSL